MTNLAASRMATGFGLVIRPSAGASDLADLDRTRVHDLYREHGALLLRGFRSDLEAFEQLSSQYLAETVTNGNETRDDIRAAKDIQTVNKGHAGIPLHAEMAYSPMRPDVLCFYCLQPASTFGGQTLVCDGVVVWRAMDGGLKRMFEEKRLKYVFRNNGALAVQCQGREDRIRRHEGVSFYGQSSEGGIDLDFVVPAMSKGLHTSEIAFANSLIVEDRSVSFEDGSEVTPDLRAQVFKLTTGCAHGIDWQMGDVLLVDNSRMMHGRAPMGRGDSRQIAVRMGFQSGRSLCTY